MKRITLNSGPWKRYGLLFLTLCLLLFSVPGIAQHSVARQWNEVLLNAIRNDFARPTVHARNLFHSSVLMYDCWSAYGEKTDLYFLGDTAKGCPFTGVVPQDLIQNEREKAMSYAMYHLLKYRFRNSPGINETYPVIDSLFLALGYDTTITSTDYTNLGAAALGNYIGQCMITYGQSDGANDINDYENLYYAPFNPTLLPDFPGNPDIIDPNRWQPLTLQFFIDQSGNPFPINTPPFLSPEWGIVDPFAMDSSVRTDHMKGPDPYPVYHDPGPPLLLDTINGGVASEEYKWNFSLTAIWSSHLDPADSVMWDVSPGGKGNNPNLPSTTADYPTYYKLHDGGAVGSGHPLNPVTGQPYAPNMVLRGDYTRVLAEFWADGPSSETPPGHWFTILNYVNDHSQFSKRWKGQGPVLDDLEWDVKAYLTLGGAMHDVAVAVWGCKGYHDYIRPISAIRYMADRGQSSDTSLSNYHIAGIPLDSGIIEVVELGDPLAGTSNENVGKIKIFAWRGPDYIANPEIDQAGVGWILVENWWPYQRPSFVTPPFAGYVSGHSTFSRTAADLLSDMTGSAFFPGGLGEFLAPKNEFLVFEEGPSDDVVLQWATYEDAADESALSRMWGGIHPPTDDIPGRVMGSLIADECFAFVEDLVNSDLPCVYDLTAIPSSIMKSDTGTATLCISIVYAQDMDTSIAPLVEFPSVDLTNTLIINTDSSGWVNNYTYNVYYDIVNRCAEDLSVTVRVTGAQNGSSTIQDSSLTAAVFSIIIQNEISLEATAVNCNGASDGAVNLTTVDGAAPYSYSWSNSASTEDLSSIAAGSYSVTVTDNNGCIGSGTVVVTEPAALTVTSSKSNISCNNQNNGTGGIFVSGGTAGYSYLWSSGQSVSSISGLSGGVYTCSVTDSKSCTATKEVNIFNPSSVLAFNILNNPGPGDINLLVSGGINPYSYNWSTGATTEDLFGMPPGFYFCQIADNNGCAKISTAVLSAPPPAAPVIADGRADAQTNIRLVNVHPNPNDGKFTVSVDAIQSDRTSFRMFDNTGRLVIDESVNISSGVSTLNFDIHHLPVGIYFLQIGDEKQLISKKIVHFRP